MNITPLISIKKRRILDGIDGNHISIQELFRQVERDSMIYVFDLDGIEHNNPYLNLYQKLTEYYILWIDNGPRRLDDVMDTIMAGATHITLQQEMWPKMDLASVSEITDDEVYVCINSIYNQQSLISFISEYNIGVLIFNKERIINDDFNVTSFVKDIALKRKIYLYNVNKKNISLWEERNITGIIVDLSKKEG